jgi:hypothetical protein
MNYVSSKMMFLHSLIKYMTGNILFIFIINENLINKSNQMAYFQYKCLTLCGSFFGVGL